jgi:hypothetical protein
MLDNNTGERIDVRVDAQCGPYIMIEPAKIARIEALLKENGISYSVEDDSHACKGTPEAAVIEFGKDSDPVRIQHVLDSVV